jgi:hypothetical protein
LPKDDAVINAGLFSTVFQLTDKQVSAGARPAQDRFVARTAASISARYQISLNATLTAFVEGRRAMGVSLGFQTDRQIVDFIEACLLTQDKMLTDPGFQALMRRPLLRPEAKAEVILRRHVWPNPAWRPLTPSPEEVR